MRFFDGIFTSGNSIIACVIRMLMIIYMYSISIIDGDLKNKKSFVFTV